MIFSGSVLSGIALESKNSFIEICATNPNISAIKNFLLDFQPRRNNRSQFSFSDSGVTNREHDISNVYLLYRFDFKDYASFFLRYVAIGNNWDSEQKIATKQLKYISFYTTVKNPTQPIRVFVFLQNGSRVEVIPQKLELLTR